MPTTSPSAPDTRTIVEPRPTTITVDRLAKSFKGQPVLHDVSLEVRAGELLALLGPSGSGKTTLLRVIAGLETPDSGRIVFSGADTTRVPVQKREVGFVFQHYALFKHMTVADNIAYGLNARRRAERPARAEIARRVEALLDLIKLGAFADRYPSQLSGGQRQRVALARALAVEPRVLLLDEPFGALDAQVRKDLRRWLRDIHHRTGQTTIFVTHDQDEALELSDRVAVLHAGRLEQVGTPAEVQDHPASIPVLRFLGDALELAADVRQGACSVAGRPVPVAAGHIADGDARLFVRPWQLEIAAPEAAHISGIVRSAYRAQGRAHLSLEQKNGGLVAISISDAAMPQVDDAIGLRIIGGHLFA
jgi:sulfate transport system ATP-binding protein